MSCCGGPRTGKEFDFDGEGPSAEDMCRFGSDVKRCASCGTEMFDSATVCPVCGDAHETSGGALSKRWVVVGAMVAGIGMLAVFGIPLF